MEYDDRKSTVSSFYGGARSTNTGMATGRPEAQTPSSQAHYYNQQQPPAERVRSDSTSSFYNPNGPSRASAEMLSSARPTAGYNSGSYFQSGREEPVKGGYDEEESAGLRPNDGFDVFADFNNAGPRYSTMFGTNDDVGYHPVHPPSPAPKLLDGMSTAGGQVEMVTVPTLGPEWKASELRELTGKVTKEERKERRQKKWQEWRRGERGLCGRYFTKKFTAWFLFGLCVAIGIVLAFTVPRVPGFQFNANTPLIPATAPFNRTIPVIFSVAPANFSFPAFADLQLDTNSNFLPVRFNNVRGSVYDLTTGRLVGTGNTGSFTAPAKGFPRFRMPLNFTYVATNNSDQTWVNWHTSCQNKGLFTDGRRPTIQFRLALDISIFGLVGHHPAGTQVTDAPCPIELPLSAA